MLNNLFKQGPTKQQRHKFNLPLTNVQEYQDLEKALDDEDKRVDLVSSILTSQNILIQQFLNRWHSLRKSEELDWPITARELCWPSWAMYCLYYCFDGLNPQKNKFNQTKVCSSNIGNFHTFVVTTEKTKIPPNSNPKKPNEDHLMPNGQKPANLLWPVIKW